MELRASEPAAAHRVTGVTGTGPALSAPAGRRALLRAGLVVGGLAAALAATWLGGSASHANADPALARLLRGMAALKAATVLGVVAGLLWRFGWPIAPRLAAAYVLGACMLTAASVLVWRLAELGAAAVLFHAGLVLLAVAGLRDVGAGARPGATGRR